MVMVKSEVHGILTTVWACRSSLNLMSKVFCIGDSVTNK